jgi:peptidoglycan/xylan/chitin deacetylase (PgdA/CDA1 family)
LRILLVLLTIAMSLAILAATVYSQRERQLCKLLNGWPDGDRGASDLLGGGEGESPYPDLLIMRGRDEESLFLAFPQPERLFVAELEPGLFLEDTPGGRVEDCRAQGLAALVERLESSAGITLRRCVELDEERLASLLERAGRELHRPSLERALSALREMDGEGRRSEKAGLAYVNIAALWVELFTPAGVWKRHGLQVRLASACRVMPAAGYRDLQGWGRDLHGVEQGAVRPLPLPLKDGGAGEGCLLDGAACSGLFSLIPQGEEAILAFMAEHNERMAYERRVRRLTFDPVPPAIVYGGNAERMEVAITLDDGGNLDPRILDLLESYGIQCTVFPVGRWAERNPEWIRRMDADGWEVANHTYTHPVKKPNRLVDIPDESVKGELLAAQEVISGITGKKYPYFRPPGGWVDDRVAALAGDLGYITVMWSLDSLDAADPNLTPLDRAERIMARVKPGQILLFHFGGYGTYETLRQLIPRMQSQGYRFVTLGRLFTP